MDDELRDAIWARDQSICQNCGRRLLRVAVDNYDGIAKDLSTLKEVPIYKWFKECWKCHKETPNVSYWFATPYAPLTHHHLGDVDKLDKILMHQYPFVKRTFSKTMDADVIANICIHCGSLQGNWFVFEDLFEMTSIEENMAKYVDLVLPINLTPEDLGVTKEEPRLVVERISRLGQIHHKDGNPENNSPDNLVLLCKRCCGKTQSGPRDGHVSYYKTQRERARSRRKQARGARTELADV